MSLFSESGNSGSSPFVRTKTSASLDFSLSVTSRSVTFIINVSDIYEFERLYNDSLYRENYLDGSSFDALLSLDNAINDRAPIFVHASYEAVGDSTLPILNSPEMEVIALNRKEARPFIRTYRLVFGRDPSDNEIGDLLKLKAHSTSINLLKRSNIVWSDEVPRRNIYFVETTNAS